MHHDNFEAAPPVPERAAGDDPGPRLRIAVVTTVGSSIQVLYRGRLEYFQAHGLEVTAVCAASELDAAIRQRGVRLHTVPLPRSISPFVDLRALWQLYRFFRRERFDLVEVGTPKAALLGALAARWAGVPCLVHILHGLAYEGQAGPVGFILRQSVAVACRRAAMTYAVSRSAAEQVVADGLCPPERITVLGAGSCNGVDLLQFCPDCRARRADIRAAQRIPAAAPVFGFVGRFARDKGIAELAEAFRQVRARHPDAILLLVGRYDERDPPDDRLRAFLDHDPGVRHAGWQPDPAPYIGAMDVFVLPTYREGLGVALLEAAAIGLPTVTTTATGCRDAVVDGETGLLVPPRDAAALAAALLRLAQDPVLRERLGHQGRAWVARNFDQPVVWARYTDAYRRLMRDRR